MVMTKTVELVFRAYSRKKDTITRGFITEENINWVTDHLMLKELTNMELTQMWEAVDYFFEDMLCIRDEEGEMIGWASYTPEMAFALDTDSAWKEVINMEARRRKAAGTL